MSRATAAAHEPVTVRRRVVRTFHFGDAPPARSAPVWYGWGNL
jgi:hypothetical protein